MDLKRVVLLSGHRCLTAGVGQPTPTLVTPELPPSVEPGGRGGSPLDRFYAISFQKSLYGNLVTGSVCKCPRQDIPKNT